MAAMTSDREPGGDRPILVELSAPPVAAPLGNLALGRALPGFTVDESFEPVPMAQGPEGGGPTVIIRGTAASADDIERIRQRPEVVRVWTDTQIAPFT